MTETVDSDGETVNGVIKIEGSVPEEIPAEPEPEPEVPPEPEIPEEPILPVKPVMVSIATDTLDLEANTEDTSPTEPQIESPSTSCDIDTEVKVMKEESTQTEPIGTTHWGKNPQFIQKITFSKPHFSQNSHFQNLI